MGIPLVALSGKYQPDPLEQATQAVQLKSLLGQVAMQPGQLELQKQQIEQQKRMLADQQARTSALQEWSSAPGSIPMNELPRLILKHGGSADASLAMQKSIVEQQTQLTMLDKDKLANAQAHSAAIGAAAQAVLSVSSENRAQAYMQKMKELVGQGIISPQEAQQPYDEETVKLHAAAAMSAKDQIDTELKKRQTAATELKEKRESDIFAATQPGGTKEDIEQKYIRLQQQAQTGKLNPFDQAWVKAYEKKKELVPSFNFNLQAQGVAPTPLNPRQEATVNAIMEGRQTAPSSFAQKSPYWQNIMGEVYKRDPQWSEQRAQLRKNFTQDKEIGAINTALGHVGVLDNAIDALNNGDVRVLNSVANRLGVETGLTPVATFKTIVHRVGPELTKAYVGAGGGQNERGTTEADFDPNLPPQTLKANTAITAQLLRSKISSKAFQWNQNKSEGMPSFEDRFIMPEAKKTLEKLNPQTKGAAPARPKGVPAEAQWDESTRTWSMP